MPVFVPVFVTNQMPFSAEGAVTPAIVICVPVGGIVPEIVIGTGGVEDV